MPTATLTRRPVFTVLLEGGPRHLPRRVEVPRKTAMSGKVKVPNGRRLGALRVRPRRRARLGVPVGHAHLDRRVSP